MAYDDYTPSGTAPVRAHADESARSGSDGIPPSDMEAPQSLTQNLADVPPSPHDPQFPAGIPEDLQVPWGWMEVALFVVLALIASVTVTWATAEIAVRLFGVNGNQVFGATMSTAKSVVVLISQALIDGLAILYLYLMLLPRTTAPFWPSIGWRDLYGGGGRIRASALQFLAGGAVMAVGVSFAGGFLNSKGTLPIEELLQARVSILLFSAFSAWSLRRWWRKLFFADSSIR